MFTSHNRTSTNREQSSLDKRKKISFIRLGTVIDINDGTGMGRIKVRIKGPVTNGGDDSIDNTQLPWSFPLLPKHLNVKPKKDELVFIFTFDNEKEITDRLYLGPIISQDQNLNFDSALSTASAGFSFGSVAPNQSIANLPQLKGVFPNQEDVSIQGRYNTDITQKNNEIVIRAGKFEVIPSNNNAPYNFTYNTRTQAFIQIKNDINIPSVENQNTTEKGSVTNIVANKINLITHKDGSPRFNVTNQNNLISDEELTTILTEAHQLPFGDVLLEYLKLLKEALFAHVHNGSGNPPTDLTISGNKQALAIFKSKADELERNMLSKNIRIN
jgi:hypothetical protein